MKARLILLPLLACGMAAASCTAKIEEPEEPKTEAKIVTYDIGASMTPLTKVSYTDKDNRMSCRWEEGDVIRISDGTLSYDFTVNNVADDGTATLHYEGEEIPDAATFSGTATYIASVDGAPESITQKQNGNYSSSGVSGSGRATEHLNDMEVLTAEVSGITEETTLSFTHGATSAYRVAVTNPQSFSSNQASLKMTIGTVCTEVKFGFGLSKGYRIVAYMLGAQATLPAGEAMRFELKIGNTDYTYERKISDATEKDFGIGKYWVINLDSFDDPTPFVLDGPTLNLLSAPVVASFD